MFDFFCDLFGEIDKKSYRFQVVNGKKLAIEGYKNILLITENKIAIKLFDGELEIVGGNLKVKKLGQNTMIITGEIVSISTQTKQNG